MILIKSDPASDVTHLATGGEHTEVPQNRPKSLLNADDYYAPLNPLYSSPSL